MVDEASHTAAAHIDQVVDVLGHYMHVPHEYADWTDLVLDTVEFAATGRSPEAVRTALPEFAHTDRMEGLEAGRNLAEPVEV